MIRANLESKENIPTFRHIKNLNVLSRAMPMLLAILRRDHIFGLKQREKSVVREFFINTVVH